MSIIESLLWGKEGSYTVFGTSVEFKKGEPKNHYFQEDGLVFDLANKCMNSKIFCWITLSNLHLFVHEMGHAIAYKLLTNNDSTIEIFNNYCYGITHFKNSFHMLPDWKRTIINAAGSVSDVTFSASKLIVATLLTNYISWPLSLIIKISLILWMLGEILYAYSSASENDFGDFGKITKSHLVFASTALVAPCLLGIFASIKFS